VQKNIVFEKKNGEILISEFQIVNFRSPTVQAPMKMRRKNPQNFGLFPSNLGVKKLARKDSRKLNAHLELVF